MQFSLFMREWLYGRDGYYSKHREIGKGGDFYTAVSSSIFFGGSISNRFLDLIKSGFLDKRTSIVEIGAHHGYLLADIVQFIYTKEPNLLDSLEFIIIEPFIENQEAQKRYFKDSFGDAIELKHFFSLDEISRDSAFIVANELFDSFECEVIKGDKMLYMDGFEPKFKEQSIDIKEHCRRYNIASGEVGVGYDKFALSLSNSFKRFEFVTFDYGDRGHRDDYSLRVYHKHNTYPFFSLTNFIKDETLKPKGVTLLSLYKLSDITYDVNFEHLIDSFTKNGLKLVYYKSQMSMLVEFGIIELLDELRDRVDEATYKSELNRAKILITPSFMGERFKGVVFRKY